MKNSFLKNASWIMIGRVVQLGLTFITTTLVMRYLGPSEYGKMTYVYSYIQLFIPLCAAGMNDIIVKELVDNKDRTDEIVGTMIVIRVTISLVSMIVSVALVGMFNNTPIYRIIALLQSFSLLFQSFDSIMYFYQAHLLSQKSGIAYGLAYIVSSIFRIVAIAMNKDVKWFSFALSLDYLMLASFFLIIYYGDNHKLRFSINTAKKLLNKSYYYMIAGILVVIYGKVTDILLLGKMVDETTVGYYSAATALCNAWPFVLTAIIDSANPLIMELHPQNKEMFKIRIKQLYAIVFYISVAVALFIIFLSHSAISIIYGSEYLNAVMPMRIYAFSTVFSYIGVARAAWIQCESKTKYETIISLFGAVTNIVLNYILIKNYQIVGAAIAAVLTQFLTNFIFLFVMKDTRENAKLILEAILLRGVLNREDNPNV